MADEKYRLHIMAGYNLFRKNLSIGITILSKIPKEKMLNAAEAYFEREEYNNQFLPGFQFAKKTEEES